ncbi:MAG: DUF3857 domain-containing protein [Verrucomicrobiaceae bacterium]|nr:MAG: DUF3857 domain-containing protein [Verrucomicrobiaceae bacterium]
MRGTVIMFRLLLCLLIVSMSPCIADSVSRELPALYDAEIKPQLTEAAPLLKLAPDRQAAERGGEVVLREHIVSVDGKSNRTEVTHNVYRAVAESGVSAVSRDSEAFNKKRTRLHLALARTIQPDGKSLPVREDAAFIQTPQRSADSDIYNDQGEMVLIYPDVKQGSATESIVVGEMEGRIPGEFTFQRGFGAGWPVRRDRFVLEAPRSLADRMRLTTLGSGVPEPRREEIQEGARIRWTWERRDISGVRQEEQRMGMDQTGPMLFITTLPDWESFIQWYLPQAEKSMELSDSLKGRIDEWTKEARSPEDITAILLRKVASEVRYVGLEFGNGDLVPRPMDVVWDNQYGDCKDKACLLAAMLRHKGINACPALINTGFPGRVERRSPDYRHFDHCITAVAGPDGKWIFCDPTIPGLAPGAIGPADSDREALLVKAGAEWARTPAHDFGTVRHRIEAVMDAAGGLSGWATLSAEGYNSARFLEMERKSTPESLRDSLQSLLSRLATGITAVDVKRHPVQEEGPYTVETYILIPGSGGASVPMLADAGYVPQTGNETQRDTSFPSWREVYEAEARITLPPGLVPASLPEPLKSVSNWAEASGGWEWKDGALLSKFRFYSKEDNIAPADFPAFAAQMRTVNAWISRPLPLKKGTDSTPADQPPAAADPMESLPHLTSVDGQMLLVENKYPEGANAVLRRAALERSIRYFPGDQEMLYRAGSQLAWLEIREGDPSAAIRRLDSFQESCRSHVSAEEAALGDYFRGVALNRLKRTDEALGVFTKLSEDKALSGHRRTWAFYWCGLLLEEKEPDQALARLREGMAMQEPEAENILYPPWARLLLKAGMADELKAGLKKLVEEREGAAPPVLTRMAQMADSIPDGDRPEYLKILTDLGPAASFGQEFATALKEAEGTISLRAAGDAIRTRLEAFLKQHPDSSSGMALPENLKTAARMTEALKGMMEAGIKGKDRDTAVKMALEAMLKSGPDDDLPAIALNLIRAVSARDFEKKESPLLDEAVALGEILPKSEDNHYEAVYARLLVLQQRGQREDLRRAAEAMIAEADEGRAWIAAAPLQLLLKDAAAAGDRPEVLRLCRVIRGYPDYRQWADGYFYEAMVLILDGQYDGALLALDALAGTPEKSQAAMAMHRQAASLLKWARSDRAAAVKWWRDSAIWWPAVLKAAEKLSPDAEKFKAPPLPVIPDQDPRGDAAATAAGKKDFDAAIRPPVVLLCRSRPAVGACGEGVE